MKISDGVAGSLWDHPNERDRFVDLTAQETVCKRPTRMPVSRLCAWSDPNLTIDVFDLSG